VNKVSPELGNYLVRQVGLKLRCLTRTPALCSSPSKRERSKAAWFPRWAKSEALTKHKDPQYSQKQKCRDQVAAFFTPYVRLPYCCLLRCSRMNAGMSKSDSSNT
jgi:hypothetical protein